MTPSGFNFFLLQKQTRPEKIFGYYAAQFGLQGGEFPDPGKVDTDIIFQSIKYAWLANQPPPAIFATVSKSWDAFVKTLDPLVELLTEGSSASFRQALQQWQALINPQSGTGQVAFSNISFYDGLVYLFVDNYARYGLSQPWAREEFELFAALGLGSGGFGSLYQVNFAEIVRLMVNGLETNQQFYPMGLERLTEGFANAETGYGPVKHHVRYGSVVTCVSTPGGAGSKVRVDIRGEGAQEFDAVIVATTNRAMQADMGITLPSRQGCLLMPPVLNQDCNTGIQQLHLMNSSKLFVLTRSKFWATDPSQHFPQNIQTDGLVRGLYCLDYPGTDHGVVLVSYTWGDDSTKYIAIKDPAARLAHLLRSLREYAPDFVDRLQAEVMVEHTHLVDWQDREHYYGAFKLNYPGQDYYNQQLYYQFTRSQNGIYLAGDSISWSGGWIEGALQTGMNAAAAVAHQFKPENLYPDNPMTQAAQASQYQY
jgi:tryptophan 2-monooxygenase